MRASQFASLAWYQQAPSQATLDLTVIRLTVNIEMLAFMGRLSGPENAPSQVATMEV